MTESRMVVARGWREVIVSWVQSFSFAIRSFLEIDDGDHGGKMLI